MLSVQLARIPRPTPPDPDPDPEEDEEKATESIVVFNLNGGTLDGKTGSITVVARIGEKFELLGAPNGRGMILSAGMCRKWRRMIPNTRNRARTPK